MNSRTANSLALVTLFALASGTSVAQSPARTIHVFVALADNVNQGIVPVPRTLGNGEDAARNLYWGAAFGIKTFFKLSADWRLIATLPRPKNGVLERCVFAHKGSPAFLVADAYEGSRIRDAITDFLAAAAGKNAERISIGGQAGPSEISAGGAANLVAYVGHDGLMDFSIDSDATPESASGRSVIILACASKQYFTRLLRKTGASPLLWSTGLMAPEAYTLKDALDGWIAGETPEQIRGRAAQAYDRYQKCGIRAATRLLVTGW